MSQSPQFFAFAFWAVVDVLALANLARVLGAFA